MAKPTSRIDLGSLGIFKTEASQLRGDDAPAKLPGYLDDAPRPFISESPPRAAIPADVSRVEPELAQTIVPIRPNVFEEQAVIPPAPASRAQMPAVKAEVSANPRASVRPYSPRRDEHRTQINLSSDTKTKLKDLVNLLVDQSKENGITQSDIVQGLIIALHDARFDWDLGGLNRRGQWGTALARSFPYELGRIFGEGIARVQAKKRGVGLRPTGS